MNLKRIGTAADIARRLHVSERAIAHRKIKWKIPKKYKEDMRSLIDDKTTEMREEFYALFWKNDQGGEKKCFRW